MHKMNRTSPQKVEVLLTASAHTVSQIRIITIPGYLSYGLFSLLKRREYSIGILEFLFRIPLPFSFFWNPSID